MAGGHCCAAVGCHRSEGCPALRPCAASCGTSRLTLVSAWVLASWTPLHGRMRFGEEGRLEPRNWKWNGGQQGSGAGGSQWRGGAGRSCRPHAGQQCTPRPACKCRRHIACPPSSCRRTVAFMITVLPNPRTQCYSRSFPQVPDGAWPLGSSQLGLHVLRRSDVFLGYFAVSLLGNCSPGWLQ